MPHRNNKKGLVTWQILPNSKKMLYWFISSATKESIVFQEVAKPGTSGTSVLSVISAFYP